MKFRRYDGREIDFLGVNFYSELADELGVERGLAKELFWMVVYRANDLRLGCHSQGVDQETLSAEDDYKYELSGEFLREVVNHYIMERFRQTTIEEENNET